MKTGLLFILVIIAGIIALTPHVYADTAQSCSGCTCEKSGTQDMSITFIANNPSSQYPEPNVLFTMQVQLVHNDGSSVWSTPFSSTTNNGGDLTVNFTVPSLKPFLFNYTASKNGFYPSVDSQSLSPMTDNLPCIFVKIIPMPLQTPAKDDFIFYVIIILPIAVIISGVSLVIIRHRLRKRKERESKKHKA